MLKSLWLMLALVAVAALPQQQFAFEEDAARWQTIHASRQRRGSHLQQALLLDDTQTTQQVQAEVDVQLANTGAPGVSSPSSRHTAALRANLQQLHQRRPSTADVTRSQPHKQATPPCKPAGSWLHTLLLVCMWGPLLAASAALAFVALTTPRLAQHLAQLGVGPTVLLVLRRAARMARAALHQLRNELQAGSKRLPMDMQELHAPMSSVTRITTTTEKLLTHGQLAVSAGMQKLAAVGDAVSKLPAAHAAAEHLNVARRAARTLVARDVQLPQ